MNAIFKRVSVRRFKEQAVEKEKLESILRAAMQAPTAGNQRPCEYYVVEGKDLLDKLAASSPYADPASHAPMAIVVCYKNQEVRFPELVEIDSAIVSENILLEAVNQGLGSVMLAVAPFKERMDAVREALDIPNTLEPFAIFPIGYPTKEIPQQDRFEPSRIHYAN